MSTNIIRAADAPARVSLVQKFAARFSIDPGKIIPILKATAFQVRGGEASDEQMAALLIVADQYGLNPFTKEIFAFPDKQNGIVPVVGVDGWSRIINDHPQADGVEFHHAEETVQMDRAKPCPVWIEAIIHRKDRSHAVVAREYLDEVYRPPFKRQDGSFVDGPWQTHTKRMLRHKALIQAARLAFGFSGIYDEDEGRRIVEAVERPPLEAEPVRRGTAALREAARAASETAPSGQGAAEPEGAASLAPDVDDAKGATEAQPAAPSGAEGRIADAIAFLDACSTREEIATWAAEAPIEARESPAFGKAVDARYAALSRPKGKGK